MLEPFIYPRSIDPRMVDEVRELARAVPRSGRRGGRARRDRLRRQAGGGRHPRRRDGRSGAAAAARGQAAGPARAQHAARVAAAGRGRAAQRSRGVERCCRRIASGGGSSTACRSRPARSATGFPATTTRGRASRGPRLPRPGGVRRGGRGEARGGRGDRRDAGRSAGRVDAGGGAPARSAAAIARSWSGWRRPPGFATPRPRPTRWRRSGARLPAALLEQAIASPDPDRALLHFRELVWRGSGACWRCCATSRSWRGCWGRCSAPAIGWRSCWCGTRRCGTRSWRGWARGCGPRDEMQRRLGVRRRRERRRSQVDDDERAGCARFAASRPRRRCASGCTTSPGAWTRGRSARS